MTDTEVVDGRYLNSEDSEFMRHVISDIECFLRTYESQKRKVLLFPPVNNYHRFLIHRSVEEGFPLLATFSIGEGDERRTVVCSQELIYSHIMMERSGGSVSCLPPAASRLSTTRAGCGGGSGPTCREALATSVAASTRKAVRPVNIYRPPAARRKEETTCAKDEPPILPLPPVVTSDDSSTPEQKQKERSRRRRPDIQVYVPRAKREVSRPSSPHASSPARKPAQAEETRKEKKTEQVRSRKVSIECDSDVSVTEVTKEREKVPGTGIGKCLGSDTDTSEPKKKLLRQRKRSSEQQASAFDAGSVQNVIAQEKSVPTKEPGCDSVENMCVETSVNSVVVCSDVASDVCEHRTSQSAIENVSKISDAREEKGTSVAFENNVIAVEVVVVDGAEEVKSKVPDISRCEQSCGPIAARDLPLSTVLSAVKENAVTVVPEVAPSVPETVASESPAPASDTSPVVVPSNDLDDFSSWDSLYDDNGDCLKPSLLEELTFSVGKVCIQKPQTDYQEYINKDPTILDDEFGHVVEIYNFPRDFKTEDLMVIFSPFKNGGFDIKWVDDTHALGVFSSATVAADVLAYQHPFVKTRPLNCATRESKVKARRTSEFLQPYKQRPATSMALARRLVLGSLGVRVVQSREQREAERRQLQEAREQKRLAARQREAAWEGTLGQM